MISYAANGRISGVYIVRRLLSEKLIFADESNISYRAGRHRVTGLQFSPAIRNDVELTEDFEELWKNVLYFYRFAEEQPYLKAGKSAVSPEYYERLHGENLTGITLLAGFSNGTFRAFFNPEETILYADQAFLEAVDEAEDLLSDLVRMIYLYAGETAPERISIREKPEISTEELSSGLSVSFEEAYADPEGGPEYLSGYGQDGDYAEDETAAAEVAPQVAETLTALRRMMLDIDGASKEVEQESARFKLTFDEGKRISLNAFSIAVPDGFRAEETGGRCVIWLPNPENPDEWEASLFTVLPEEDENAAENFFHSVQDGMVRKTEAGQLLQNCGVRLSFRITGVTEETASRADEACRKLLDTLR